MSKTILVVGATGNYAQPVCRSLAEAGFDVRVFTSRPEKAARKFGDRFPIHTGSVEDIDTVRAALAGCWGVHVSLRGWIKTWSHDRVEHLGTANVARAAVEAGVDRLTYLSCLFARPEFADFPHLKAKVDAEAAIRASGIPFAIFAPTFFMENLHHLRPSKRIFVPAIGGDRAFHYVATDDYTRMVVRAFQLPEAPNRRFEIFGPEPVTQAEATLRFCARARPGTRVHFVPVWVSDLYQRLIRQKNRQYSMKILRLYQRVGEVGDPAAADYPLGRPTTTYDSWCAVQPPGISVFET